jgi:parallel beta-helix repeat protein
MLDRPVALKFLAELLIHDPMALDDLKRETRRALELTHHNIVRVYDLVEDLSQDLACIAMEFFPGKTMTRLRMDEPNRWFDPESIAPWIGQLCDAMHYAHEKVHVVHRDLKPQNLMVDDKGDVKITDFGVARVACDSLSRVSVGKISGTPCYMSPQQARGETPLPSDDIYSIGATLYEMLTSRPPFFQGDVAYQLETVKAPPIRERRKELTGIDAPLPDAWEETIAACLAKDVTRRPPHAREIAERLGVVLPSSRLGRPAPSVVAMIPKSRPPSAEVLTAADEEMTNRGVRSLTDDDSKSTIAGEEPPVNAVSIHTPSFPLPAVISPSSGWAPLPAQGSAASPAWAPLPPPPAPPPPVFVPFQPPASSRLTSGIPIWLWVFAVGFVLAGFAFFVGALVRHQLMRNRANSGDLAHNVDAARPPKAFSVPGDFSTIQAAIDAARSGDTVQLRAGTYREALMLKQGVHLVGENASTCRVEVPAGAAAGLFIRGGRGTSVENITFDGGGAADPNVFSLGFEISEDPNGATVRDVVSDGPAARAGLVSGARVRSVDGQVIEEAAEAQYLIARGASARDVTLEYEQNGGSRSVTLRTERRKLASVWPDGVVVSNADVSISRCVIQRFGGIGLLVYGARTTGSVDRNTFLNGLQNGCSLIRTTAELRVTNNEFRGNAGAGLRFENANSIATGNVCAENRSVGMHISGRAAVPTLRGNTCKANAKSGLYFAESAGGFAEDNTCEENIDSGIFVIGLGTAPTLRGNRVRSNRKNGILFSEGAAGRAERNICEQNDWPALCAAGSGTAPVFQNNRCVGNKQSGIYFNSGAGGTAEQNYCAENGDVGISVNGEGTNPRLVSNEARENKESGILFSTKARGLADRNTCTGNKSSGISVTSGAVATLSGNTCSNNTLHGISFTGAATGAVSANKCEENGDSGLASFLEGTAPTLTGNTSRRNKHYGIYFGGGASGEATDNTCEQNVMSGIGVANAGTRPSISGNQLNNNEKFGLEIFDSARAIVGRNGFLRNKRGDRYP